MIWNALQKQLWSKVFAPLFRVDTEVNLIIWFQKDLSVTPALLNSQSGVFFERNPGHFVGNCVKHNISFGEIATGSLFISCVFYLTKKGSGWL